LSHSSVNILNYSPTMYNWTRGNSSNKLFEYMASGKPIISTVKMGYSPIIGYSCGLEIENCNGQALSEKIVQIKNMEQSEYKQMSENAAAAAQEFDYHVLSQKLNDLLTSVAKEKQNG
ncbi:MAG: glycosyltransferase WbuB, partial [Oscillospiraceae bacterium]|nr:glycosyltransferase WbuB [Candidatus Equicaccousia limihippi]